MKTIITLSALALISNAAIAGGFEYERQVGSQDLDPNVNVSDRILDPEVSNSKVRVSLHDWYRGNPDVVHVPYNHEGTEKKYEGNFLSNYDALSRTNPDLMS